MRQTRRHAAAWGNGSRDQELPPDSSLTPSLLGRGPQPALLPPGAGVLLRQKDHLEGWQEPGSRESPEKLFHGLGVIPAHVSAQGLEPPAHSCAVSHGCLQSEELTFPQTEGPPTPHAPPSPPDENREAPAQEGPPLRPRAAGAAGASVPPHTGGPAQSAPGAMGLHSGRVHLLREPALHDSAWRNVQATRMVMGQGHSTPRARPPPLRRGPRRVHWLCLQG